MRKYYIVAIPIWLFFVQNAGAQKPNTTIKPETYSLEALDRMPRQFDGVRHQGSYYLLLHFDDLPSAGEHKRLAQAGVELLSYMGSNTYQAAIPEKVNTTELKALGAQTIAKRPIATKSTAAIRNHEFPDWAVKQPGTVDVVISFHDNITRRSIQHFLQSHQVRVLRDGIKGGTIVIGRVSQERANELAESPIVGHVDVVSPPVEPLVHENKNVQRTNVLSNPVSGLGLTGKGVCIGIGDGGKLGDHIDFVGRVMDESDDGGGIFGSHGDQVTGIVGSAGNLNPRHVGIAPESELLIQNTSNIIWEAENYYDEFRMVLTNNSYGVGSSCWSKADYTYESAILDKQQSEFVKLLHVYAAGNGGLANCNSYPQGFKSILPYYQTAKNILTVGSIDENRNIANNSSKGPLHDGRLKPEICGVGVKVISTGRNYNYNMGSGTSFSSPSVTGSLALLYQRYRKLHNGEDPDGALIKAIACNSADDLGNPGPDYTYGFGLINARRASSIIEKEQYFASELSQGINNSHQLSVPAGVEQVKIMLYWPDKEAGAFVEKALVNNLDLVVETSTGEVVLPWVLDPTPSNVDNNAIRGVDTVNNNEQVTLNNPASGEYQIIVKGTEIPFGPQNYYLVYEFIYPEVVLTYPFGGESFVPGEEEIIQWDADPNNAIPFVLEYSVSGGESWTQIASGIGAEQRSYLWTVPSVEQKNVFIRISKQGTNQESSNPNPFHFLSRPENLEFTPLCEGYANISWDSMANVSEYEILALGKKTVERLGSSAATNFTIANASKNGQKYWYSLRGKYPEGIYSGRTISQFYIPSVTQVCPWEDDIKIKKVFTDKIVGRALTSSSLSRESIKVQMKNLGNNTLSGVDASLRVNGKMVSTETIDQNIFSGDSLEYTFAPVMDFSQPGNYIIDAWLDYPEDLRKLNDTIYQAMELRQIANDPIVKFPYVEEFLGVEESVCEGKTIGIKGIEKWDFASNTGGCLEDSWGFVWLSPPSDTSANLADELILTLNIAGSNLSDSIMLGFSYYNMDIEGYNEVLVRGSDADEWLEVKALALTEGWGWDTLAAINLSDILIAGGQDLSSSFQLKFTRTGQNGLMLNSIAIDKLLNPPTELTLSNTNKNDSEFAFFKATKVRDDVRLNWEIRSKENTAYFDIEWSESKEAISKGTVFSLGRIKGNGISTERQSFQFLDNRYQKIGPQYYRLKQVTLDGSIHYSRIESVQFDIPKETTVVYPNPFIDNLSLKLYSTKAKEMELKLFNTLGHLIHANVYPISQGTNSIDLTDHVIKLPKGVYYINVLKDVFPITYKLVKH